MGQFDRQDDEGNPWGMIFAGALALLMAWYILKGGSSPHVMGKAGLLYSVFGKKIVAGLIGLVGTWFLVRGLVRLREGRD